MSLVLQFLNPIIGFAFFKRSSCSFYTNSYTFKLLMLTDLLIRTSLEKISAGNARMQLISQMNRMVSKMRRRPGLGARGRTMTFLLSLLMARRVKTLADTLR